MSLRIISPGVLVLLASFTCHASFAAPQIGEPAPLQAPLAVEHAIRAALAPVTPAGTNITLGSLDGANFMPACTTPLHVNMSGLPPYEQAAIGCLKPAWTLYVTVTIMLQNNVLVAARPIAAGQIVQQADVRLAAEPVSLYAGQQVFYNEAAIAGASASISLPVGAILTTSNIQPPEIVRAGQAVTVIIYSGAVKLSMTATANQSGRVGDVILLTNPNNGKRFSATVTASGPEIDLGD